MSDKGKEFVKKIFGDKLKFNPEPKSKISYLNDKLQKQVHIEEAIVANKIKLKTLKSITGTMIDEAFDEVNLDEYIKTLIQLKVSEKIKSKAYYIVEEALDDIEDNYDLKRTIHDSVIKKIKSVF